MALNDVMNNWFTSSVGTDRSATVALTSGTLIPANPDRTKFIVKNDTANNIWINLTRTASAVPGNGNIKIAAGGYFELDGHSGTVTAISETAPGDVTAREW
jgi:hypothetical protein